MKSVFLSLNTADFIKGLALTIITAVISIVYQVVQAGSLSFDWKAIGTAALSAGLGYIIKNLLTNSTDTFLSKEK
jgi:hypothetical protein